MINLIYGVTGQTGSYLADLLLELDQEVVGVSRGSVNTKNIDHIKSSKFSLVNGDVTDCGWVQSIIKDVGPERIFNMAGQSSVGLSFGRPASTFESIATGTLNILEAIRNINKQIRFVTASSSQIFGNSYSTRIIDNPGHPLYNAEKKHLFNYFLNSKQSNSEYIPYSIIEKYQNEDTVCKPEDPYGIAKLAAFHMTKAYRESYDLHVSSAILFNHDSARRGPDFVTSKITHWVKNFSHWNTGDPIEFGADHIYKYHDPSNKFQKLTLGNINIARDFGNARDYVRAIKLMIDQEVPDDYVICTGQTYTLEYFLKFAFMQIGIDNYTDFIRYDQNLIRPSNIQYTNGDNTKIRSIGWAPTISIEETIKEMIHG